MKTHYNLLTQIKVRICCVIALIAAAQSLYAWDYLTVYRNDGEEPLELFLADVDRMVCSKIGTDSLLYADWQVQEIWAPDTTYRIPLASIDSIRIKTVDPEEANRNLVEASKGVSKIFLQTENISELASHLDEIRNMETVEKAWVNGTSLLVKVKDWGVISFSFPISYETTSEKENAKSVHKDMKKAAINPSDIHSPLYYDQSLCDICIINQAYNDENRSNVDGDAIDMDCYFGACGFDISRVNGQGFNLNFLKNDIYDYDIILMATHGCFDGQHHWIYTGQQFKVFKNFKEIDEWTVEVPDWVKDYINNNFSPGCVSCGFIKEKRGGVDVLVLYAAVSESFFAKSDKRFNGDGRSLFFNTACQSMQENHSFPITLLRKGLGYYLGYTHTNSVGWPACKEFTELILNGYDYVDAKQNHMSFENKYEQVQVPNQQGEIETVVSELVGAQHISLKNVHTCIVRPETLEPEYPFDGKLYGKIRQLNPSKTEFTYGFCIIYSEDEEIKVLDGISFNQCSYDSYSHTVSFNIELDDYDKMKVGDYYYCAYIYDGKNYCFGDVKQLTVKADPEPAKPEPYTVWDYENKTITIYYDVMRLPEEKPFTPYGPYLYESACEKVVFDPTFANYFPESTDGWFSSCKKLKTIENIQYLNTSKVTDMSGMFFGCSSLTSLNLSSFNTANVTSMRSMFFGCSSLTSLDIGSFNTANVTDMSMMFNDCSHLTRLNLSSFDTAKVKDTSMMFWGCKSLTSLDLSCFNTANVTSMGDMFSGCESLTSLDFRNLYLKDKVGRWLFENLKNLKHINLENANTVNATSMDSMFEGCTSLTSLDLSSFNTDKVEDMYHMFLNCSSLTSLNLSSFNTAKVTNMREMFSGCNSLTSLDFRNLYLKDDFGYCLFHDLKNLKHINLENANTVNATSMYSMFEGCTSLTSLDLSSFNTSNVTSMGYMFSGCSSLTILDFKNLYLNDKVGRWLFQNLKNLLHINLENANTVNATSMAAMFDGCSSLTSLDLSSFNTSNVTAMEDMFDGCSSLTSLDLSCFDTSNVTDMSEMFADCTSLTSLDLSSFNTAKVEHMSKMFSCCSSLTSLNLSCFDTSNVRSMSWMFKECSSLKILDLSSFNTAKIDYISGMDGMFLDCSSLRTIYAGNWGESYNDVLMFKGCENLAGGQGTKLGDNLYGYDQKGYPLYYFCYSNSSAAHIDGGKDWPGLFTAK